MFKPGSGESVRTGRLGTPAVPGQTRSARAQARSPRALETIGIHLNIALGLSNEVGPPHKAGLEIDTGSMSCEVRNHEVRFPDLHDDFVVNAVNVLYSVDSGWVVARFQNANLESSLVGFVHLAVKPHGNKPFTGPLGVARKAIRSYVAVGQNSAIGTRWVRLYPAVSRQHAQQEMDICPIFRICCRDEPWFFDIDGLAQSFVSVQRLQQETIAPFHNVR